MTHSKSFLKKMTSAGMAPEVISLFLSYYEKLAKGDTGIIHEQELEAVPPHSLPTLSELQKHAKAGEAAIPHCAVIKLNGGLGTSMGLSGPKSFLPVKEGKRFIDIVADQTRHLRKKFHCNMPLIMMNSAVTTDETEEFLSQNSDLILDSVAPSFVHHSHPKVTVANLETAHFQGDAKREWNPAGHGDIYAALVTTGVLDDLLAQGIHYAFISNIDNLGATFNPAILGSMIENDLSFIMEVAPRREMDKKGGHIARNSKGHLILRERAQAAQEDIPQFEDITKYAYFNTNSLWIDLRVFKEMVETNGLLELPFIANRKHLNPTDITTEEVYQIETAMGSALGLFKNAAAVEIPLTRFRPVKKNDDLLLLWSDRFKLNEASELIESEGVTPSINLELDSDIYAHYTELQKRIPADPPSLKLCNSLIVHGDFTFGKKCRIEGDVVLTNKSSKTAVLEECVIQNDLTIPS